MLFKCLSKDSGGNRINKIREVTRIKKSTIVILMVMVNIVSLTACGSQKETSLNTAAKKTTVVDAANEEVTVNVNPKRVAIYETAILDILNTVGFDKTGIETLGIAKTEAYLPDYLSQYRDSDKYVNVGDMFEADYDVLDLLQPDLIIGGARFGHQDTEGKTLEDVRKRYPDVDYLNFDIDMTSKGETYEGDLKRNFKVLGQVFPGIKDDLDAAMEELSQGFADVREKAGDARTLFLMIGPGYITFYGPEGRYSMVYNEFGFTPADSTTDAGGVHGAEVSAEYVKQVNPDIILLLDRNASFGEASSVKEFLNNTMIQETNAYKNNNIYELNNNAWYLNTGGLTAARHMIADMKQVTENNH